MNFTPVNFKAFYEKLYDFKRRLLFAQHNNQKPEEVRKIVKDLDWLLRIAPEVRCMHEVAMRLMDLLDFIWEILNVTDDELENTNAITELIQKIEPLLKSAEMRTTE